MNISTHNTQSTLSYSLEGTRHIRNSQPTLPVTHINTCTHRSSIFNKYEKYNSSKKKKNNNNNDDDDDDDDNNNNNNNNNNMGKEGV